MSSRVDVYRNVDEYEINPTVVFVLLVLLFITQIFIKSLFIFSAIWCLIAGTFFGYLVLKFYDEIPNVFVLLQITGLTGLTGLTKKTKTMCCTPSEQKTIGCSICSKEGCSRHRLQEENPWENLVVSKSVDDALTEFFEIVLNTHTYSWYRDLSRNQGFVDEVRYALRQAASVVCQRLKSINLSKFIIRRILTKYMIHVDCFFLIKEQVINKVDLQHKVLSHLETYKHFCVQNDRSETEYLRYTIQTLLPILLPKTSLNCKSINYFLQELMTCVILKPLVERTVDPDFINRLLLIFLGESTILKSNDPPSEKVNFLESFAKERANYVYYPSLNIPISELIHNAEYLYPFMQFLKCNGALNILQFCLSVEEFNKRTLAAETVQNEVRIMEELQEIYHLYFNPGAIDKINFPDEITQDFLNYVSSLENRVDESKTAAPLFRAYEHAVDILEKTYAPLFHQSPEFFALKCGDRSIKVKKSIDEMNLAKRKFMGFADLSKITNKIRAKKLGARSGEKLTSMDELDYPTEEGYEAYDSCEEDDEEEEEEGDCNVDSGFDLNRCHITIPTMDFVVINSKRRYVYMLTVELIGGRSKWQVVRKYNEFYVLDSKLRRFHDTLNDAELPPKRTLLKKDFEYLSSMRTKFQEYIQRLARSHVLRASCLLQRFLTNGHEIDGMFEQESVGREAERKVKNLRSKLVIEKGQNLEVFLDSFITSAEPPLKKKVPPKPIIQHMYSTRRRHNSAEDIPPPHWARELRRSLSAVSEFSSNEYTVSQFILYTCRNFFKVPTWVHHLLMFFQYTCKNTMNMYIERFLAYKISVVTSEIQLVSYIQLIRDVIFFDNTPPRTDSEKVERRDGVLAQMMNFFPRTLRNVIGVENHEHAMKTVHEMFQYPLLNKHLFYVLLDEVLYELFPEIQPSNDDDEMSA